MKTTYLERLQDVNMKKESKRGDMHRIKTNIKYRDQNRRLIFWKRDRLKSIIKNNLTTAQLFRLKVNEYKIGEAKTAKDCVLIVKLGVESVAHGFMT